MDENNEQLSCWYFEPQPDITAYEVALVIKKLVGRNGSEIPPPEEIDRHFIHIGGTITTRNGKGYFVPDERFAEP